MTKKLKTEEKMLMTCGAGVPGGILLPLLVLGAVTGGIFARGADALLGCGDLYLVNFVILGMAGYFSAIVRSPITGVILITEMTGDFRNFLFLSVVALIAYLTADLLGGQPIYDQLLHRILAKGTGQEPGEEERSHKVLLESDVYIGSRMERLSTRCSCRRAAWWYPCSATSGKSCPEEARCSAAEISWCCSVSREMFLSWRRSWIIYVEV